MAVEETGEVLKTPQQLDAVKNMEFSLDDSSPRGVLDIAISSSDSDNSSSTSNDNITDETITMEEKSTPQKKGKYNNNNNNNIGQILQWKSMIGNLKKKSGMSTMRRFSGIPLLTTYETSRKNIWKKLGKNYAQEDDESELTAPKPSWKSFEYTELAAATQNFSEENMIGKGGHAQVYKGKLHDGQLVAIKRIMKNEKEEEDRVSDFLTELGIIAHINHSNAVRLIGFSTDNGLYLVIKYLPQGSLASLLFGSSDCTLDWGKRFKVAVGIAEGLQYLHHDCHRRIIHRDITASNILLTENYDAQITDFGLAKWLPENWAHHVVHPIEGTFGYLAPEYFMHGVIDEKTDVFAFGVLLLEIITGRRAVDSNRQSLVLWAKALLESNNYKDLAAPELGDAYDKAELKRAMLTASMCLHHMPGTRPYMNRVVQLLKGEDLQTEVEQKTPLGRSVVFNGCDLQDYNCSSYLKDINRHKELVME